MPIHRRALLASAAAAGAIACAGCLGPSGRAAAIDDDRLTLATTTSAYDTGLLDELNAAFRDRFGVEVEALAQGTGAALETGRGGDADVVLVHARGLEDRFIREGHGVNRRAVMTNDFVLVGPPADPAEVASAGTVGAALRAIAAVGATFVSRGDDSGTHRKELALWEASPAEPGGDWYVAAGTGMGEVLTQTDERGAYTLADRGTYLAMRDRLDLEILLTGPVEGGPPTLANPYGVIAVNPARHPGVDYDLALAYIGFVTGPEGQSIVEGFTVDGEVLFVPTALAKGSDFGEYVPSDWSGGD